MRLPRTFLPVVSQRIFAARRRGGLAAILLASALCSGCSGALTNFRASLGDSQGLLGSNASETSAGRAVSASELQALGRRYDAKPGEKASSIAYGAALRANGQHAQAVAVLQNASIKNVGDREIAAAYGKSLADIGRFDEAMQVLAQAHSSDRPDWRVLSSQGAIADQLGQHARAREFYAQALQIAPGEPNVLANLGLSHVLTKDLARAEDYLQQAASRGGNDPRIAANLALVKQLRGVKQQAAIEPTPKAAPAKIQGPVSTTAPAKRP